MEPLHYHAGQREVQREANTEIAANRLADWVGPVIRYASLADLIVMAALDEEELRFAALSGPPPLVAAEERDGRIHLQFPGTLAATLPAGTLIGGIVLSAAEGRRSRFAGRLDWQGDAYATDCDIAFTNCRKYIAPTVGLGTSALAGPASRVPVALDDPQIERRVGQAVTAFLGTVDPDRVPDVSHRGGEPGFLTYAPSSRQLTWVEFVGDGMFKSAGNLRATGVFSLLVTDPATGDALELRARGTYQNLHRSERQRVHSLLQSHEAYPVQGRITAQVERAFILTALMHPRQSLPNALRRNSRSPVEVQAPD